MQRELTHWKGQGEKFHVLLQTEGVGGSNTRHWLQAIQVLFPRNESRGGIPSLLGGHGGKKRRGWKHIITPRIFCLQPVKNTCWSSIVRSTEPATVGVSQYSTAFLPSGGTHISSPGPTQEATQEIPPSFWKRGKWSSDTSEVIGWLSQVH